LIGEWGGGGKGLGSAAGPTARHSATAQQHRTATRLGKGTTTEREAGTGVGEFVRLEVDGGIGTIRLERPPMNALNAQVQNELREAALEAGERRDVAAVVVYGGEKVFAAGADIKEMQALSYTDMVQRSADLQASFTAIARIPKPTVAAVTGYALGGGCELALCCDFRVAGENAKLGQPEILLGIIPGAGGTQRLSRLVGPARAKDLIFSGRFVDAAEALRIGLVDELAAPDEVYAAARRRVEGYVGGPAFALRAAKEAVDRGLEVDLDTGLEIERLQFAALFATKDREIGMTSFVEHGPGKATFEGR
jgi:enoyl-CoA hydratase/carnithine racemase